ncbi:MAG: PhoD-like phosphatase N-terminal domain-containing protein, partial [Planctomycetaceae bacterium]
MSGRRRLQRWTISTWVALCCHSSQAAELGMGFRVGEISQNSAIIWTRITQGTDRNANGYREPSKRSPRQKQYQPSPIKVADRQGAMPGASGQVRVRYGTREDLAQPHATAWVEVSATRDFTHQFHLANLQPNTRYHLSVEAR